MQYISDKARKRIRKRGISDEDIGACLANHHNFYMRHGDKIYCAVLPDGRNIKVTIRPGPPERIVHAFIHHFKSPGGTEDDPA